MWTRLVAYVRGILGRRRASEEADEELAFHLAQATTVHRRRGLSPTEARRAALRELGGLTQTREAVREVRVFRVESLLQDVRYAVRQLRRAPAFALTASLVLGLGIGVTTAVFSVANVVFFRSPAVTAPDRLAYVYAETKPGTLEVGTWADFEFFREHSGPFTDVALHFGQSVVLQVDDEPELLAAEWVSGSYFEALGVSPVLGRTFGPEVDATPAPAHEVVISHDLWERRFHSDPHAIGQEVRIRGVAFTVIGVAPASFLGLVDPWTRVQCWYTSIFPTRRASTEAGGLIGRLKPGEPMATAGAAVRGMAAEMLAARVRESRPGTVTVHPYVVRPVADVQTPFNPGASIVPARVLAALMAVATLVLLIAATNIAGLVLARGIARTPELAIRRGLGASAGRLVRQLATEGLALSAAGTMVGGAVAWALVRVYQIATPARYVVEVPIDFRVLAFGILVSVGTGLLIGLSPARHALRLNVVAALGAGVAATDRVSARLHRWVLVPQVSASFVLLLAAGIYTHALADAEFADLGYRTKNVVMLMGLKPSRSSGTTPLAGAALEAARDASRAISRELADVLLDRLQAVPGLSAVAIAGIGSPAIGTGAHPGTVLSYEDFLRGNPPSAGPFGTAPISPGYLRTMGIDLLAGRDFDRHDSPSSPHVAIVSAGLARRLWPNQVAVGHSLAMYHAGLAAKDLDWLEVIGVARDVTPVLQVPGSNPDVWAPMSQQWHGTFLTVAVYTVGEAPPATVDRLKRVINDVNPAEMAVFQVQTMKDLVGDILYERRAAAAILAGSASFGLLLGAVALVGLVSYTVARRDRELGVRGALGASGGALITLVLRDSVRVLAVGLTLGACVTPVALRLVSHVVGLDAAVDAPTLVVVAVVMLSVVAGACYVPARRAARVDPVEALRSL